MKFIAGDAVAAMGKRRAGSRRRRSRPAQSHADRRRDPGLADTLSTADLECELRELVQAPG
jgi:hypothetical protein